MLITCKLKQMIKELRFETSKGKFLMVENTPEVLRQVPHDLCDRIGLLSVLTEGQAREIVESWVNTSGEEVFINYVAERIKGDLLGNISFTTALASIHSLIKSKGWYLENPIPPYAPNDVDFHESAKKWFEAESRTLNNPVIFKIK